MDTVTESRTAITGPRTGGLGIIHRNLRCRAGGQVEKVKKFESGMISDPIRWGRSKDFRCLEIMPKFGISGLPVTQNGKLLGILTNRDLRFESGSIGRSRRVMTKDKW